MIPQRLAIVNIYGAQKDGFTNVTLGTFYIDESANPSLAQQSEATLLLHGFPTSSYDFSGKVWEDLKSKYGRIIALDYPGYGFSDKPRYRSDLQGPATAALYSVMNFANITEDLLQSLGVSKVHILAHDLGDTLAQELLARQLDRDKEKNQTSTDRGWLWKPQQKSPSRAAIQSCCFLNGGLFPELHKPLLTQQLLAGTFGYWFAAFTNIFTFKQGLWSVFGPLTKPTEGWLREAYHGMAYGEGRLVLHRLVGYMAERRQHRSRWVGALENSTVPLAVINGPWDPISGGHVAVAVRDRLPHVKLTVLPDHIGHYPQVEAPDLVLDAYHKFRAEL